jgi:hypothetical protein
MKAYAEIMPHVLKQKPDWTHVLALYDKWYDDITTAHRADLAFHTRSTDTRQVLVGGKRVLDDQKKKLDLPAYRKDFKRHFQDIINPIKRFVEMEKQGSLFD